MSDPNATGRAAEDAGLAFLQKQGLKTVTRNFNCRLGEIDLVMKDSDSLVFVEVRYRGPGARVFAIDTIDNKKRKRLQATALHYLQVNQLSLDRTVLRFDVLAISGSAPGYQIDWVKNALD